MENVSNENELLNGTALNDTISIYFAKPDPRGTYALCIGLIIFISNLLVVISSGLVIKKGMKPKCPYLLLGSISLTDLITGCVIIMFWFYPHNPTSAYPCCIYAGVTTTTTIVSFYNVALIALDRFLYIVHGLKYNTMVNPTRVRMMIILTWIFGILVGFVPVMIFAKKGTTCWLSMIIPSGLRVGLTAIGGVSIFFVMILCSIIVFLAIKTDKKMKTITNTDEMVFAKYYKNNTLRFTVTSRVSSVSGSIDITRTDGSDLSQRDPSGNKKATWTVFSKENKNIDREANSNAHSLPHEKWRAVKIVIFTAGTQLIIWCMYLATTVMSLSCDRETDSFRCEKLEIDVARYVGLFGFAHHMFNPVIYYWWHNGFRNIINKLFCK